MLLFIVIMSSANYFFFKYFQKILLGIPLESQTVWIQIRPNLGLNCLGVKGSSLTGGIVSCP